MRAFKNLKFTLPNLLAPKRDGLLWRYGVAMLAVLIAFGIRYALSPMLGFYAPFILFVPAIIIAAWVGGLGPSLLAGLATFLLADYFFVPVQSQWPLAHAHQIIAAVTYIFVALVVAGLMQALRQERLRVIQRAERLQKEVEQRQRAEAALRQRDEHLCAILENSSAMIFLKDVEGRYLISNREFEAITHRPAKEIIGRSDSDLFPAKQAEIFRANDSKVLRAGVPMQFEEIAVHDDGPHTSIVYKFPLRDGDGNIYALGGVVTDITERKRMEDALKQSEEKYRSLYVNTPVMLHSIDQNGVLVSVSNFWLHSLGYKEEEVIGRESLEFLTSESQKHAREVVLPEYFKTGICRDVSYQMVKKNGEVIDVLLSAIAEKDEEGKVVRSLAVIIDVTAQKRAERALRASGEKLRILTESTVDAIVSADANGNVIQFNPAAEKIFGWPARDILGTPIYVLMPEKFREVCRRGMQQFLATGQAHLVGKTVELAGLRKDGTEFPLELSLSAWESSEGKFFTAVLRDITERKTAEETIRRSEELLRMTTEAANVYVWDWDIVNDRMESSGMARMAGNAIPLSSEQIEKFAPPEDRAKVWKEVEKCLRENGDLNLEYRVVWADGSIHWQLSRGRPFYENGRPIRLLGISMDITERKNAEEALRRSEALLRMTTDAANVHVWNWDLIKNLVECPQLCRFAGKPAGVSLEEFLSYVHSEDRASVKKSLEKSLREKSEFNSEYRLVWTDGSVHWQFSRGQPVFDDGRAVRLSGVSIDFTARRKSEEALRESEALLRLTTNGANIGLWSWDVDKGTVEWNPVEYRQFGIPYGKRVNLQMFLHLIHPDDRALLSDEIDKCLRENRELNVEHRILRRDGTLRWNQCKGGAFYENGRAVRFSGMSLDITARKEAQDALRRSEELLRITTEGAGVGLWSWDVANDVLEWNPVEYQQIALRADAEMRLQTFLDRVHPDDRGWVKEAMESCLRERRELTMEYRLVWPDGTVRWRLCKGTPSYVENRPVRFSGMSLDITERKQAQEALRRQAELLNLAQVLVFDMNETILFWNHQSETLYGYTEAEALGKNRHALLHSEAAISQDEIKKHILRDGFWSGEMVRFCKNGEKIVVAVRWVIDKDEQNRPLMVLESSNDITALKKTETDLQKAQRDLASHAKNLEQAVARRTDELQRSLKDMESFCYTIAHDLRAPLRAMSGFSYSLAEDYAPQLGPTGRDYCERIHAASARMSQLISDLLLYGRLTHRELPSEPVDLETEIEKVLSRAAPQIEERHAEIKVDKPLFKVCGDAPVLDQILENLIINAVKFVPSERLPRVHIYAEHHENNIRLCVEDNGIGILPEHWKKIFRPFERLHTSAYPGTGIGLAIVERGIEKMGGQVGVESTPEHGSRFWVELPEQCKRL